MIALAILIHSQGSSGNTASPNQTVLGVIMTKDVEMMGVKLSGTKSNCDA